MFISFWKVKNTKQPKAASERKKARRRIIGKDSIAAELLKKIIK